MSDALIALAILYAVRLHPQRMTVIQHDQYQQSGVRSALQAGFTLLELLVVLVIVGMTASFVGPSLWHSYEQAQERDVARAYGQAILALRRQAFHNGRIIELTDADARRRYGIALPQGWQLTHADRIVLLPTGVTGGGRFELLAPSRHRWQIRMRPFDGRMQVERL